MWWINLIYLDLSKAFGWMDGLAFNTFSCITVGPRLPGQRLPPPLLTLNTSPPTPSSHLYYSPKGTESAVCRPYLLFEIFN